MEFDKELRRRRSK